MFVSTRIFLLVGLVVICVKATNTTLWESHLQLGSIKKPLGLTVNGSIAGHQHFLAGYLCLHSFLYDTAIQAFDLAINDNPKLVEAYIGRIFGFKQPLSSKTDMVGGLTAWNYTQNALKSLNITPTDLQSAYLSAVYQWYASDLYEGERAFLTAMTNLTRQFPKDADAQSFLGLAYLNVAGQPATGIQEIEPMNLLIGRAILEYAYLKEPDHPGILHYIIHSYDIPKTDVAIRSLPYTNRYTEIVRTASHAVHMPAHIYARIGQWPRAQQADIQSVNGSLFLCIARVFNQIQPFLNTTFSQVLSSMNDSAAKMLLECDRDNRPHQQYWLGHSHLQVGDYKESLRLYADLIISYNRSESAFYLPYAYRGRTHIAVETFFWLVWNKDYRNNYTTVFQDLIAIDSNPIQVFLVEDYEGYALEWSEAAVRLAYCFQLLLSNATGNRENRSLEWQLERMANLSMFVRSDSEFVAASIKLMVSQVRAVQWCLVNNSISRCLTELSNATEIEATLVADPDSPPLLFIRSAELLAFFLLRIYRDNSSLPISFTYKNSTININQFPSLALSLYIEQNSTAPQRPINLLGMFRAHKQLGNTTEATNLATTIEKQWSNTSSPIAQTIIREITSYTSNAPSSGTVFHGYLPMLYTTAMLLIIWHN